MSINRDFACKGQRLICENGCGTFREEDRYGEGKPCPECGYREWRTVPMEEVSDG